MRPIGVGVWGLGPHALKNILPALRRTPGVRLDGVCSRNAAVVERVGRELSCKRWIEPGEMLGDPDVEAVYLATPIGLHAAQGMAVLEAGRHLWCEKPLGEAVHQIAPLVALSRARSLTLAEGFMYLYHPQFAALQEVIASGRLGVVHTVSSRFGIPPLDEPRFRTDPSRGGGAFLDVGSYPLSAVTAIFPDAEPEVSFSEILKAPGSAVDSEGRAVLRVDGGVSAVLEWRINCAYRNEIDVWGTAGSVSTDKVFSKSEEYVPRFCFRDERGVETCEPGVASNHFVAMLAAFRRLVDEPVAAERERQLITRRARLVDRVRDRAQQLGSI